MKIILIGNKARMGKDTFANMLKEELNERAVIIHFADALKFVCKSYYGWNGEKNTFGRTLLQYVGQSTRDNDEHFWTDFIARLIKANLSKNYEYIIIPDWRYKEEYERLLRYFHYEDIITVNITRFNSDFSPYIPNELTFEQRQHKSEIDLDTYVCQYYISNFTLEKLRESAQTFVKEANLWYNKRKNRRIKYGME